MSEIEGRLGGFRDDETDPSLSPDSVDGRTGRWLRRHIAGGVVAVTTVTDRGYRASTVSACLVASVEPLQMLVSIELDTQMADWLLESRVFAVSILQWRQKILADQFAGLAPLASPTFAGIDFETALTGSPILKGAIGWADCVLATDLITGDHRLFVGNVVAAREGDAPDGEPLIYYANRYLRIQ
jgi:flavin reductase (DIM6/NTAB) family NADH-FMN oxidoreductase RutF